jgi:hypothetical protein
MDSRRVGDADSFSDECHLAPALRPTRWEVSSSVYGRGTMLYGPFDKRVAVILAPPSVPLPTPPDWQAPLASSGWRAAWMMPLADGSVILDEQEPFDLDALSFADAVEIVLNHCPEHLGWLCQQVSMRASTTVFTLHADCNGVVPPGGAHREAALVGMLASAEEALARHRERLSRVPGCPLDGGWVERLRETVRPVVDRDLLQGPPVAN